jgi:transposase
MSERKPYPSDVSDEEWDFIAPYVTLLPEDVSQRRYPLREVYNGLRWVVRTGATWRMMPHDLPPWPLVYQQTRRWLAADCFENAAHDLVLLIRQAKGRNGQPTMAIIDSRTLQSTPESGGHAGYDGAKKRKGSKVHLAVDTLGQYLALIVSPANEQDRAKAGELVAAVNQATGGSVQVVVADQGYTGEETAAAVAEQGAELQIVKLPQAKHGFVLLPRRWVVERSFAWLARFRRLARDYERLPTLVAGLHVIAFTALLLHQWSSILSP